MRLNPLGAARATRTAAKKSVRRPLPVWRRPLVRAAAAGLVLVASLGAGWQAWRGGWVEIALVRLQETAIAQSAAAGLAVDEVFLEGRRVTPRDDVIAALGIERGESILTIDPRAARERLEKLGWVRHASVERRLPDMVHVRIEEREPLALWQNQGKLALIDRDGEVILRDGVEKFAALPLLVGPDAPAVATEIIDQIALVAGLPDIVEAAIHVSGRRWNLRLKGDIEVRLPEEDVGAALIRLGRLRQKDGLLDRNVIEVDLRQPDRLVVRQIPSSQSPDKGI